MARIKNETYKEGREREKSAHGIQAKLCQHVLDWLALPSGSVSLPWASIASRA